MFKRRNRKTNQLNEQQKKGISLVSATRPGSVFGEQYRTICINIQISMIDKELKCFVVTWSDLLYLLMNPNLDIRKTIHQIDNQSLYVMTSGLIQYTSSLERLYAKVLGVVFNGAEKKNDKSYSYYGYGYGYDDAEGEAQ